MSKTDTFSKSIDLAVINEYDKDNVMELSKLVRMFTMLLVEVSF